MLEPYGNAERRACVLHEGPDRRGHHAAFRATAMCACRSPRTGRGWAPSGSARAPADWALSPGSTVDAAFHLEINEYHNRRSVQLVICDVQLSECEHRADQLILNLYNILMQDGPLTALEARRLLPERKDPCRRLAAYRLPRGGRTALRASTGRSRAAFPGEEQTRDQHRQAPRLARRLFRVRPHQLPFQRGHDKRLPQALRG